MKFTDDINKNFVVKWSKALTDSNNAVTSGVFHAPAEEFITKIEDEAQFIKMVRYVEMDGEKADLEQLRVHPRLQNMQKLSSSKVLTQDILTDLAETTPEFLKTTLTAVPLTTFTNIPKGFLKTNLEGEAFTSTYENILAPAVAFSADKIAIFGKVLQNGETAGSGGVPPAQDGMLAMNGVLAQLDAIAAASPAAGSPQGKGTKIYRDNIVKGIQSLILEFIAQDGKVSNAQILVSAKTMAALRYAIGNRETDAGDHVFFDGELLRFDGIPVVAMDALNKPERGFGDVAIILDPAAVAYGPVFEAESESEYSVARKSYLTSIDYMFDVGIIFAEDILYVQVGDTTPSD